MITLAAVLAGVALVGWRLERVLRERIALERTKAEALRSIQELKLAIRERQLALEEQRLAANLEPEEVPADLRLRYEQETEPWAREQLRALIRELHAQFKSWDGVRTALGQLDAHAAHMDRGWSQTTVLS